MLTRENIQIRDPFVLPMKSEGNYYLYGSTDKDIWKDRATGFDVYRSTDLVYWEGPFPAFRPPVGFWSDTNYWAPEVHEYKGKFYMFATFKAEGVCRGTQVLVADHPLGPFIPHSDGPLTPRDWECLDGTLFVDDSGIPWMVFCHEWVQISDGTVCAIKLSDSLDQAIGDPIQLFSASQAKWAESKRHSIHGDGYVTDGPFLYRCSSGTLVMIWSSFHNERYAQGIAVSKTGDILGPWVQQDQPLYESDGGHGMIFTTYEGKIMLALHSPNQTPNERMAFIELEENGEIIRMK
jgi:arabinan endo-1,5-alpha-L-arabinosidase